MVKQCANTQFAIVFVKKQTVSLLIINVRATIKESVKGERENEKIKIRKRPWFVEKQTGNLKRRKCSSLGNILGYCQHRKTESRRDNVPGGGKGTTPLSDHLSFTRFLSLLMFHNMHPLT